ncbi:MAG TPA: UDP-N-acetylmuramoyl-tripeptide--D-alanyl-D-alanine ligase [Actinomycetota bacterium]|nr:UDP-N-acetylmuramoyl-tripeptide--D-alanyl-D-alanine ligase [Actinomycetota bacterium]
MKERPLSSVAEAVGGRLIGEDRMIGGAVTDSRDVRSNDLYVALVGQRADGHDFVAEAFERGAAGALVARGINYGGPVIVVGDTGRALMDLAADEREQMSARVLAITGSTGKTSVKDLTAAVLALRYRVTASPRSFNTEVGVPLTLLAASPEDTEVVVCEMGSRGRGHISLLARVARPHVGVVTNVGPAHLEMFGSLEGVAEAKAELVEALPQDGTAVLNADDPHVRDFARRTKARTLLYGTSADSAVRGEELSLDAEGRASFTLRTPEGSERVELAVPGEHMAWNALAACGGAVALGLSAGECAAALKEARISPWRMEVFHTADGVRVINDAYNANPASMGAALKAARWMAGEGRCIAVLGEMAELGGISEEEHERIGELVARLGIERLITVGTPARRISVGAVREGVEPERVTACETVEEALAAVRSSTQAGDVLLVKASRRAGLERLAEALRGDEE